MRDLRVGLRVDVDTFRGTRLGVPGLCKLFGELDIRATFFLTAGPDNMGRHLWRLLSPPFLWKMLRSNAPGLYGWDIVLRGTLWPGPVISKHLERELKQVVTGGHEIGFHAWDHHAWQARAERWNGEELHRHLVTGFERLSDVLGQAPTCSAAPAWKTTSAILQMKEQLPFRFNSDCRGDSIFLPASDDGRRPMQQPQIPATLPTFDEVVGRGGVTASGFFDELLGLLRPGQLNVLTVHAEVEGMSRLAELARFITSARRLGWSFVALGDLLEPDAELPVCRILKGAVPGRAGWVSCQEGWRP